MKKLLGSLLSAILFVLVVPAAVSAAPALPLASGCTPQITSISSFAAQQTQSVTIKGKCFGTGNTVSSSDTPYFKITTEPSTASEWHACYTNDAPADFVTCNITSWTNTSITFSGFTGQYGQNGWVVNQGNTLLINVWNPQTNQGPGTCTVIAGTPGTTQSLSAKELARAVLCNANITLSGRCVRKDIVNTSQGLPGTAGTPVSPVLLSDLLAIASSQRVIVTAIESCGSGHSRTSSHYKGLAMDLVPGAGNTLAHIARTLYNNRVSWSIDELIYNPMPKGTTTLKHGNPFTYSKKILNAHRTHVHFSVKS